MVMKQSSCDMVIKMKYKKTLFQRFFCIFLFIWIPFVILTAGILQYSSQKLAQRSLDMHRDQQLFLSQMMDRDLLKMHQILYMLCVDADVTEYAQLGQQDFHYKQYLAYITLQDKMTSYLKSGFLVDDYFLIFPSGDEISSHYQDSGLSMDAKHRLDCLENNTDTFLYENGNMFFCLKDSIGLIAGARISVQNMFDMLYTFFLGDKYHYILVNDTYTEYFGSDISEGMEIFEQINSKFGASKNIWLNHRLYAVYDINMTHPDFHIITYIPWKELYQDYANVIILILVLVICSSIVPFAMMFVFRKHVEKPLKMVVGALAQLENGNYDYRLLEVDTIEFFYVFHAYNDLAQQLKKLIQEVLEKQLKIKESQLHQLQSHINPHFLFNSLYVGYRMAKSGQSQKVAELCLYLGNYFKYITYLKNEDSVIGKEVDFMRTFLLLHQMRFTDRMEFHIEVEKELEHYRIPTMLLQPLIENAIKYGVEGSNDKCIIYLRIFKVQNRIQIKVQNSGSHVNVQDLENIQTHLQKADSEITKQYGLWNVQQRLHYMEADNNGLSFSSPKDGWFEVSFTIQCKEVCGDVPFADCGR